MLVSFLRRGFHNGSIVEPGETISVSDDTFLGQHMVRVDGDNDHLRDPQPFVGAFRAELAYFPDPDEVRAQLTEAARVRAEATRQREAMEEAQRVQASVGEQPPVSTPEPSLNAPNPEGGGAADG